MSCSTGSRPDSLAEGRRRAIVRGHRGLRRLGRGSTGAGVAAGTATVFAPGQRVGAARDCVHVDRRLAAALEFVDELRHRGDGIAHDVHDLGRARQRLADDAIQDAFDAPRELADAPRADHAAAALQRVEHPAYVAQGLRVQRVRLPLREQRLQLSDVLAGFLDEQQPELGIDRRRLDRRSRGSLTPAAARPCCPATAAGAASTDGGAALTDRASAGDASPSGTSRRPEHDHVRRRLLELREAGLGVLEHVPLVRAPGLQHLHVVLDGDDRIGEPVEPRQREGAGLGPHDARERTSDALHHLDGTLLAEHQQAGRDAAHELRHLVEALRLGRRDRAPA